MARPSAKKPARGLDRGVLPSLLGYVLRRTQSAVFADFAATFAGAGEVLTPGEFGLLVLVERNGGLSQMTLARALGIDRSTLVPILDRLQERGLVVRGHERRIATGLSADETRTLLELLDKVRTSARSL